METPKFKIGNRVRWTCNMPPFLSEKALKYMKAKAITSDSQFLVMITKFFFDQHEPKS